MTELLRDEPGLGAPRMAETLPRMLFLGVSALVFSAGAAGTMMLPCLVPTLWRYRQPVASAGGRRLGSRTALVGIGYFSVWTVFGMAAFAVGVALAAAETQQAALARAVPTAVGPRQGAAEH